MEQGKTIFIYKKNRLCAEIFANILNLFKLVKQCICNNEWFNLFKPKAFRINILVRIDKYKNIK